MNVRINKLLSDTGLGSRREVEALIEEGRVWINGDRAELSDVVSEDDVVELDGEELPVRDLLRDMAAEQKQRIAEQASVRIGRQYIDVDDDNDRPHRARPKNAGAKKDRRADGFAPMGKPKTVGGRPAKFRKDREDERPSSRGGREEHRSFHTKKKGRKGGFDGKKRFS